MGRGTPNEPERGGRAEGLRPRARRDDLIVSDVADEVLVYDLQEHRAHTLNRSAALVWRECDGQKTIGDLAARLQQELGASVDEQVVWLALGELDRARLLEERVRPPAREGVSRRQLLRRLGASAAAGAVLLPAVGSIVAPHPAAAQTPLCPPGTPACTPCAGDCTCEPAAAGGAGFCVSVFAPCPTDPCGPGNTCPPGFICVTNPCCDGAGNFCEPLANACGVFQPAPGAVPRRRGR